MNMRSHVNAQTLTSFSSSLRNVTNPYFILSIFGFRATQAGTNFKLLACWNNSESISSVTNSHRLPTQSVVDIIESGSSTISYRAPPIMSSMLSLVSKASQLLYWREVDVVNDFVGVSGLVD